MNATLETGYLVIFRTLSRNLPTSRNTVVVSKGGRKSVLVLELRLRHFTIYTPNLGGYGTIFRDHRNFPTSNVLVCLFVFFLIFVSRLDVSNICINRWLIVYRRVGRIWIFFASQGIFSLSRIALFNS